MSKLDGTNLHCQISDRAVSTQDLSELGREHLDETYEVDDVFPGKTPHGGHRCENNSS